MLFEKKDDKPEKIRQVDPKFKGFKWVTVYKGDKINLPEDQGLRLGLVPVKMSIDNFDEEQDAIKKKIKNKKEPESESKKKQSELYKAKIKSINGIGNKTAKDLIQVFPTEEKLINVLKSGKDIPIRDDLAKLIKEKFKIK